MLYSTIKRCGAQYKKKEVDFRLPLFVLGSGLTLLADSHAGYPYP